MSDLPTTSKGKIARLPARLREAVNRRLHDGETAGQILPWLNTQAETVKMLELHYEGEPISPQNLSAWRQGGFQKWLAEREEIETSKERARFSMELAKASGGNLSEGALALLTGEVMEMVEEVAAIRKRGEEINPKYLTAINKSLVAARAKELDTHTHQLNLKRLEQKDRELDLAEKSFQVRFAETFLKFFDEEETRRIATSGDRKETKVKELVQHWFGEMPDGIGPPALRS